jgi:hypothetical protein
MDITLPTIPAGVLVLLGLLAPYVQALIQRPHWSPAWKKIISVALAIILTALVLIFYFAATGDVIPDWPVLVLLVVVVAQASYTMVTKASASALEVRTSPTVVVHETPTASTAPSRDQILADFAKLDPDEQTADMQAAIARVEG